MLKIQGEEFVTPYRVKGITSLIKQSREMVDL